MQPLLPASLHGLSSLPRRRAHALARSPLPTISNALTYAKSYLKSKNVSEPQLSSQYLLQHVIHQGRVRNPLPITHVLTKIEMDTYRSLLRRRALGEPIQYIVGEWSFRECEIYCVSPVLIPRPETELIVDIIHAIDPMIQRNAADTPARRILEIGCGSGCISTALLMESHQHVTVTAVDVSEAAVALTQRNIHRYHLSSRVHLVQSDIKNWHAMPDLLNMLQGPFDGIVSNPPYIPSPDLVSLQREVRDYEDWVALDGGHDGMHIINQILTICPLLLKALGWCVLEVSAEDDQCGKVEDKCRSSPLRFVASHPDLRQKPRFCHLQLK